MIRTFWLMKYFIPPCYLTLIKLRKRIFFSFKIAVKNFVKDQRGTLIVSGMHFEFETVRIPCGFYNAKMLCNILNKKVEQFGMQFSVV